MESEEKVQVVEEKLFSKALLNGVQLGEIEEEEDGSFKRIPPVYYRSYED